MNKGLGVILESLFVIGAGPGDESLLTAQAKSALEGARRVLNTRDVPLPLLMDALRAIDSGAVAVLVSGDSGFFSVAKKIVNELSGLYDIELIPGISSIQYLSAKLKT